MKAGKGKPNRKQREQQKTNNKMAYLSPTMLIITLSVNGLNTQQKTETGNGLK